VGVTVSTGKSLRLSRIFDPESKTTVIVPMDHPLEGYFPELSDPSPLIASLADAGADAFLLRKGTANRALQSYAGKASLILRVTSATSLRNRLAEQAYTASVREAIRLGADAVIPNIFVGSERELEDLHSLGILSDACDEWGMPLMIEAMPIGGRESSPFEGPYEVDDLRVAVRTAAEEGADLVKTFYSGDSESFRKVTSYSTVPVVIAGGPKADDIEDILRMVDGAIKGGAKGIALGRKVWGSKNPPATLRALRKMVHGNLPVEKAISEFKH
jgi:fructose-bisphosphate aldolase / 2-amino-3,7-dideoxy-D-threo-hept-6-ulosonate synthase